MYISTSAALTLTEGDHGTLRVWRDEEPSIHETEDTEAIRDYETLGYVISGTLEITIAGTTNTYRPGEAYHVPSPELTLKTGSAKTIPTLATGRAAIAFTAGNCDLWQEIIPDVVHHE